MQVALGAAVGARALFGRDVVQDRLRGRLAGNGLRPWPFFLGCIRIGRRSVGLGSGSRGGLWRGLGLCLCQDLLGEEQELGRVDPLTLGAVALAEELFELVLELVVEMDLLASVFNNSRMS